LFAAGNSMKNLRGKSLKLFSPQISKFFLF